MTRLGTFRILVQAIRTILIIVRPGMPDYNMFLQKRDVCSATKSRVFGGATGAIVAAIALGSNALLAEYFRRESIESCDLIISLMIPSMYQYVFFSFCG